MKVFVTILVILLDIISTYITVFVRAKTAHVTWQDEKETPTPATSTPCPDLDLASPPSSPAPRVPKPQLKPLERRPSLRSQVQDQIEQDR